MPDPIAQRLAALPQLSKSTLYDMWKELFQRISIPETAQRFDGSDPGLSAAGTGVRITQREDSRPASSSQSNV
jgi:hypothetical protein